MEQNFTIIIILYLSYKYLPLIFMCTSISSLGSCIECFVIRTLPNLSDGDDAIVRIDDLVQQEVDTCIIIIIIRINTDITFSYC